MAQFLPLRLLFQACCLQSGLARPDFSDCQDDSSTLQVRATSASDKAVTCPNGEEEFTFDAWSDGLYTLRDEPVSGVTISGYTVAPDDCKQPAILSSSNTNGPDNEDISNCRKCSVLGVADQASPNGNGLINRCQPSAGAPTIELTFATPRDILSVTFLNVETSSTEYSTTFTYIKGSGDSQTVTIPAGAESRVDIRGNCKLPQNVERVKVQFGNDAGFKGMKVCQPSVSLVGDSHVGPQPHALPQATSSTIGKLGATLTCPHGEEEYTFSDLNDGLYTTGDQLAPGITISGYTVAPDDSCNQPAIVSAANAEFDLENLIVLQCDCRALGMARYANRLCRASEGAPRIELTFDAPQDIMSVTFQGDMEGPLSGYLTTFTYQIEGSDASHTVTIRESNSGSRIRTVGLSGQCLLPQNVKKVTLQFGFNAVFKGMNLCKGGASLVGDPHVRTQDHAHYTVLNEGNFLAWRFKSHTLVTQKSGLKKVEVDWPIYAHYSAHRRSWTRGLLLVDQSMGSHHQSFEFTSEECKLRKRIGDEWNVMESSELFQVSEAGDFVTGFNFTHLEHENVHFDSKKRSPKGTKARWDVQFLMATPRGRQQIATVQLRCFPGRHIDVQIIRERMADARFVQGQLGHHEVQLKKEKNGLGHWFHTSSDHEFQLNKSWLDLGGSRASMAFFELEETKAKTAALTGNPTCSPAEKKEAMKLCQETMKMSRNADKEFLDECVLDICSGGGEAAAELAGDIFSS